MWLTVHYSSVTWRHKKPWSRFGVSDSGSPTMELWPCGPNSSKSRHLCTTALSRPTVLLGIWMSTYWAAAYTPGGWRCVVKKKAWFSPGAAWLAGRLRCFIFRRLVCCSPPLPATSWKCPNENYEAEKPQGTNVTWPRCIAGSNAIL